MPIYVALDLETTGLDPERDAIIEIGAVKFRGDEVLEEFSTLINPGRPLPHEISLLTGLTDDELLNAPRLEPMLPRLSRFVGELPVVGHNVSFDLGCLRRWSALLSNSSIDTFRLAAILAPDSQRYSLGELAQLFEIPLDHAHRALDDARATHLLFQALFQRACALPTRLLEELVRLGEQIDWHPAGFFRHALRAVSRATPQSTIAAQLAAKEIHVDAPIFAVPPTAKPLEPKDKRRELDIDRLAALLEQEGAFAQRFPGYEYRPQQVDMLRMVGEALNEGRHVMVEAPTGVGKSLAYLIPSVYWAAYNSERVVISTNTINLQEQLYRKDLPELSQVCDVPFQATVLKGRSHYLCLARLAAMRRMGPSSLREMEILARVLVWLPSTFDGDGDTLFLPTSKDRAVWSRLSARFEGCEPDHCRYFHQDTCFFYRARRAAEAAHLIIINHALLLADVAVQNRVLPEYRCLIVDEAHHLELATTSGLSFETDRAAIGRLLEEVGRTQRSRSGASIPHSGLLAEVTARCRDAQLEQEIIDQVEDFAVRVGRAAEQTDHLLEVFFDRLERFVAEAKSGRGNPAYAYRLRVTPAQRVQPAWDDVEIAWDNARRPLEAVSDGLERLYGGLDDLDELGVRDVEELQTALLSVARRIAETLEHLSVFVMDPTPETIYWVQTGPRNAPLSIHAAPLHVGPLVQEHLFHKKETVVLTSATLRTGESFDYLRERLHAWDAEEMIVDSPFDYEESTLVYLIEDIPEPGQTGYQRAVEQGMLALFKATQGRSLGLFTSYSQLRATTRAIKKPLNQLGITVYAQGQGLSRNQLLENFRSTDKAVLLGTRSFWEGIDVPGEALSCLAIAKLPFNVPSDPVFAARAETFDYPFMEYAVPEAVLRFLQGFGRLIRTRTDRGVVVLFDRRLISKSYGPVFLDSLPGPTIHRGPLTMLPRMAAEWLDNEKRR